LAALIPELRGSEGQRLSPGTKEELMSSWNATLNYLNKFIPKEYKKPGKKPAKKLTKAMRIEYLRKAGWTGERIPTSKEKTKALELIKADRKKGLIL